MFPQHLIAKKRDGHVLTRAEIAAFVRGATDGSWADYQLSAMLMAIFLRGMNPDETAACTDAMMRSGAVADLSNVRQPRADKHSTGGVGDKVSLHLAPMIAACGVAVPMISGRGLGHTGGTLDKLEAIPGFNVNLSFDQFRAQVERVGLALVGQTRELAPADKKLYALRDVTATVECIPLICASILSKKLAEGTQVLVCDVKFGRGAFMKERSRARELAEGLVRVGTSMGTPTRAVLTSMEQPLGRAIGHSLEVIESVECLKGNGPADTMEVTYALGEQMLLLAGQAGSRADARRKLEESITSRAALQKFRAMTLAQGGDASVCDNFSCLPRARQQVAVTSPRAGFVEDVDPMQVALAVLRLGGGRMNAEARIDHAVGIDRLVKIGEPVEAGQPLGVIHANAADALQEARAMLSDAVVIGDGRPKTVELIGEVIG